VPTVDAVHTFNVFDNLAYGYEFHYFVLILGNKRRINTGQPPAFHPSQPTVNLYTLPYFRLITEMNELNNNGL
jgi:hypothetical protein